MREKAVKTGYGQTGGLEILGELVDSGRSIFTSKEAQEAGKAKHLDLARTNILLALMADAGLIRRLKRGLYAVTGKLPGSRAPHDFAIATAMFTPSAISHASALNFHGLSEQARQGVARSRAPDVGSRRSPRHLLLSGRHEVHRDRAGVGGRREQGADHGQGADGPGDVSFSESVRRSGRGGFRAGRASQGAGSGEARSVRRRDQGGRHGKAHRMGARSWRRLSRSSQPPEGGAGEGNSEAGPGEAGAGPGHSRVDASGQLHERPVGIIIVIMIPLQKVLQQRARKLGLPLDTVAKDYVIGHLLAAISAQPELGSALVFKGGTALKKLYFGDYRFSEDLDYTAVKAPSGKTCSSTRWRRSWRRSCGRCFRARLVA